MDVHAELMARIAQGDRAALSALYEALEKPVFRFIQSKLNDPFEAADILHDVFIDVWRSAGRFEGRSKVQTWIFGIAYRKVIDIYRKRGKQELRAEFPEQEDETIDTEMCVAASQEAEHVRICLDTLKPEHRDSINLAFYQDMTYREIAEVVGSPEGTIKTRVFHAKNLLLKCLSGRVTRGFST
jgi:RNA polymerase sigma-70 factor (ECF subfamily)